MARRLQVGLAGAGLTLAALDAYAVVTLLPQMMGSVDLPIDHVEAAAPILTAFLGGYVVAMPLLGAFSDVRGRLPAYAAGLAAFAIGSAVTALAPSLPWLVAGRGLQGLGGGALVPLSLALAADLYPDRGRPLALGALSALQELGSVVGPVYGALLAVGLGDWRPVFWLNLPLAALILGGLLIVKPAQAAGPGSGAGNRTVDWLGASLLGLGLGLGVAALYPDDPAHRPVNLNAIPLGGVAVTVMAVFAWRQWKGAGRFARWGLLRSRVLGGVLVANLLAGGALMVALVDLPLVGRGVFDLDTFQAGLLLSRFLLGVPLGALAGGWLAGRLGLRMTSVAGLILAGAAFALISRWGTQELVVAGALAWVELVACGIGFGLMVAPLTTAALGQVEGGEHGLASSLVVLSRTFGMVVALAGLTAFGLARFQVAFAGQRCDTLGGSLLQGLAAWKTCVRGALLQEYREIFLVAAGLCALAALASLAVSGSLPGRGTPGGPLRV